MLFRSFKTEEYASGHQRLVYNAYLYKNSKEYLKNLITEEQLISSFDNSVESLVKYWKFGDLTDSERKKLEKRYSNNTKRLQTIIRLKTGVQGHVSLLKEKKTRKAGDSSAF